VEVLICSGDAHTRDELHDTIVLCDTLAYPNLPRYLHELIGIVNGLLRAGACNDSIVICDEMLDMGASDSICIARLSIQLKRRAGEMMPRRCVGDTPSWAMARSRSLATASRSP
jgi:hypothetical protein